MISLLDKYAKERLQYRHPYNGVIQDFHINADGTTQLLFEELRVKEDHFSIFNYTDSTGAVHTSSAANKKYISRLGEIGIARLDESGKETGGYAIAKDQVAAANVEADGKDYVFYNDIVVWVTL